MNRRVVIDASAMIEIVLPGPRASVLIDLLENAAEVLAPDLMHSEVANALWKYIRAGALNCEDGVVMLERASEIVDVTVPDRELSKEALVAAVSFGHSVYDMCYAVLARREGGIICTLDHAFARTLLAMSIPVNCPGLQSND